eukprot:14023847-Ditylum_brightwellii.AAC.2
MVLVRDLDTQSCVRPGHDKKHAQLQVWEEGRAHGLGRFSTDAIYDHSSQQRQVACCVPQFICLDIMTQCIQHPPVGAQIPTHGH